ncbi:hypothetical protein PHYBOEH_002873 [Phytophthora boehmeriae]|uniref:Uncharacterized protein n=1 Tax=Phytophthora boehmeriae TaxID=109152 RepID=A0A8T1WWU7_9STRA|nr:hypothetical protein PHYBOEH_002873 [Phytophthora boehmeriae]
MDSDDEERVQRELAVEVRSLRHKLRVREQEVDALQGQVDTVTTQLHETSEELERRMEFVADAMTQIETLEAQVAEAKRCVLTYEMQLHEGTQRERAVEAALQGKEKQCEYWESEFHRVDQELSAQQEAERELNEEIQAKSDEVRACKAKLQAVLSSVDELKQQNESHRKKERTLVATLRQQVEAAESNQRSWKARLAKRELKIDSLRRQCQDRQKELEDVERERKHESEDYERHKITATEEQIHKQKDLAALRDKIEGLTAIVEKAQAKELLFRREIFRLRGELLLSESQRETEQQRQEQLLQGKEKEVAFIWQKYVEIMSMADERSQVD